ncbi:hypothetical protein A6A08_21170 [Nocardiopsis sp. TSRI0078]|uniref:hypothetical protein n=1 Tax=unclassified Nocardiopsis TaxID=2649073 RepID=UPI00093F9EA1|nr:hypothetical protein [Nocardiopsis sp. TSRI0078]OKI21307.1 hypothetical protein A6A08_21170 [Nocardiopsis sp. TSRI0078]
MFENVPNVTVSDWFASAEITSRMLRTLNNIGPGGVIIADLYRRDYYATHSRTLNHASQTSFIVYGYHDLAADMAEYTEEYGNRAWEELVPAVDCTVWECLDEMAEDLAGPRWVLTRMRQTMHELGFDLTSAPYYYDRYASPGDCASPTTRMVRDRYACRAHPALTVTVKSPVDEKTGALSLIRISDGDRHVTGWPARMRTQFTTGPNAHRVREAIEAYLRRTRT